MSGLCGSELPTDFMEAKAFARSNDNDWQRMRNANANSEATQRSIAISLKRIADALDRLTTPQGSIGEKE